MPRGDIIFAFGGTFLLGVLAANLEPLWVLFLALIIFILTSKKWKFFISSLLFIPFIFGFFYFHIYKNFKTPDLRTGQEIYAKVENRPAVYEKYQKFRIGIGDKDAWVITSPDRIYKFGDEISISVTKAEDSNIIFPEIKFIRNEDKSLRGNLFKLQEVVVSKYRGNLSQKSAALLSGIMLGYKSDFSRDFREELSNSGTSHIVALSGYNIAVLIMGLSYFLIPVVGRKINFIAITIFIVLFTLMVGGEPSIVRAAIMGFLVILAKESGRMYSMRNSIILAAFLMILSDPSILAGDIGFQLSFLSLLGIVYISPHILRIIDKIRPGKLPGLKENSALTLSSQVMVLPVILGTFGKVSILGVVANILILSFVPVTMLLGFVFALFSFIWSGFAETISWPLEFILRYMLSVIHFFSNFEIGPRGNMSLAFSLIYYAIIALIIYNFRKNEFP